MAEPAIELDDEAIDAYAEEADDLLDEGEDETLEREDAAFWALDNLVHVRNLAEFLSPEELATTAQKVMDGYEVDLKSMERWLEWNKAAMEIVKPEFEARASAFDDGANAKLPMIVNAAIKFSAEAYPELVKGGAVVKESLHGPRNTPEKIVKAQRAAAFQNWQVIRQMPNWEEDTDRLIFQTALLGTVHRKVWWNTEDNRPDHVLRVEQVVVNNSARSPEEAPRVSETFDLYGWEIEERVRRGDWIRLSLGSMSDAEDAADHDNKHTFIEQTCRLDLDRDGYDEPYIVTVAKETQQIASIQPNWRPKDVRIGQDGTLVAIRPYCYYIRYGFLPPFDNGYWMMGFGVLLGPLNDSINALVNQLLDSGALANNNGGWISSAVRMPKGMQTWSKGEWKTVQVLGGVLRDAIVPLPVQPPSQTLFALLGFLVEHCQQLSSVTSVMSGEQPRANMPAASVLALIEQGKKTFGAIYKRIYRALDHEMRKIADMNYQYGDLDKYKQFHDNPQVDIRADFDPSGLDFSLVATPEFASKVERIATAEALLEGVAKGLTGIEPVEVSRMYVTALVGDEQDIARLMPEAPTPTTQQIMEQAELAKQQALQAAEVQKAQAEAQEAMVRLEIAKLALQTAGIKGQTDPVKAIAGAERAAAGAQSAQLKVQQQQLEMGRSIDEHGMAMEEHAAAMRSKENAE